MSISGAEVPVLFRLFHRRPLPSTGLQEFRGRSQELEGALTQAAPPQRGTTGHGLRPSRDRGDWGTMMPTSRDNVVNPEPRHCCFAVLELGARRTPPVFLLRDFRTYQLAFAALRRVPPSASTTSLDMPGRPARACALTGWARSPRGADAACGASATRRSRGLALVGWSLGTSSDRLPTRLLVSA